MPDFISPLFNDCLCTIEPGVTVDRNKATENELSSKTETYSHDIQPCQVCFIIKTKRPFAAKGMTFETIS